MKKSMLLKVLAMVMALSMIFAGSLSAFADDPTELGDLQLLDVYAEGGQVVYYTENQTGTAESGAIETGEVKNENAEMPFAVEVVSVDESVFVKTEEINYNRDPDYADKDWDDGAVWLGSGFEYRYGADRSASDDTAITFESGDISSDQNGIEMNNVNGSITATTGSINAANDGVYIADYWAGHDDDGEVIPGAESGVNTITVNGDINIVNKEEVPEDPEQYVEEAKGVRVDLCFSPEENSVTVNGDVNVDAKIDASGVAVRTDNDVTVAVNGGITVNGGTVNGMKLESNVDENNPGGTAGNVEATLTEGMTVTGTGAATGLYAYADYEGNVSAKLTGDMTVDGTDAGLKPDEQKDVTGIFADAEYDGNVFVEMTGDMTISGAGEIGDGEEFDQLSVRGINIFASIEPYDEETMQQGGSGGIVTVKYTGDMTITSENWGAGVQVMTEEDGVVTAEVNGTIDVSGNNVNGLVIGGPYAGGGGTMVETQNGNITVTGTELGHGVLAQTYEDGSATVDVTGDITVEAGEAIGVCLTTGSEDMTVGGGSVELTMDGDVSVTGTERAFGVEASVGEEGIITADLTGDITVKAEDAVGIYTENYGGDISITAEGDVTSNRWGIEMHDEKGWTEGEEYEGEAEVDPEGDPSWPAGEDGSLRHFHFIDGNTRISYLIDEDGNIYDEMLEERTVNHDPGTTSVKVVGDVTADETGAVITLDNEKSTMDLIVDGTLSGKTQSVLVSEDTIGENLTLTVWEIKANKDDNLVERITGYDDEGENITEADKELEKKIQYIIKVEPTQTNMISTNGTTKYGDYDVAKEGDTVTLKVNVPEGYQIAKAFNGTDTKVELAQDAEGNYYLIVPRGGAVMLSVELEKIPDPAPAPAPVTPAANTVPATVTVETKVAIMADVEDTTGTTELKNEINALINSNGDILSIFTDEIRALLGNAKNLLDDITLSLENYDSEMGTVTVKVKSSKTFTKGEIAKVVIALPDGNGGFTYFYVEGEGQDDGTLALNLTADLARTLAGKSFVTMILE